MSKCTRRKVRVIFAVKASRLISPAVRQKKIPDLRSPRYSGSDKDWEDILRFILLPRQATVISERLTKGLEAVAAVGTRSKKRILTITVRNHIDQITQKVGSIDLEETEDDEINLFDWATLAIDEGAKVELELSRLRNQASSNEATIALLSAQLEDLVKAKADHEEQLISKFTLLLNEKKLKIRNQQRILSTAKVDKKKLAELKLSLDGNQRLPASATSRKRHAETETIGDDDEDESVGFETMDVDPPPKVAQVAHSSRETTPDTETGSEDEKPSDQQIPVSQTAHEDPPQPRQTCTKDTSPPPKRELPFAQKGQKGRQEKSKSASPKKTLGSDEETESGNDEL